MSRHLLVGGMTLLASVLPAATSSAVASTPVQLQDEWLAWHGCWQAEAAEGGELLCIVPDGAGVRMITIQGNAILAESRVVADGRSRSVRRDDCSGTERAHWSADGRRVFLTSELDCSEGLNRKSSGMFVFTSTREWLSVQAVTIGDQTATRAVRYQAVEPAALPVSISSSLLGSRSTRLAARQSMIGDVDESDVEEAVNSIDPVAVQEWLDATGQPYSLGGDVDYGQDAVYMSALDQVGRMANPVVYKAPKVVHIVERPTYVHRTHVTHVVRSCWDPFFSGFVIGGRVVNVGVSYGYGPCGRYYYSRYSPWGYDLYGWRFVHAPLLVVRHRPIIIRRGHGHYYYRGRTGRRDFDDHDRGGRVTRSGYQRDGGRVTRDGYSSDRDRPRDSWQDSDRPRDRWQDRDRERTSRDTRAIQTRDRDVARPARVQRTSSEGRPSREVRSSGGIVRSTNSGSQRNGAYMRSGGSRSGQAQARPARAR